jgi:hypothetical protein
MFLVRESTEKEGDNEKMSEDKITKDSEAFEELKKERKKTVDMLEKDQIDKDVPEFPEIDEESEDIPRDEFTIEKEENIAKQYKAGDPAPIVKDERFSKEHEIDEAELRKNKQKNAPSGS